MEEGKDHITLELQKWAAEKANILLPSTKIEGLSEWHKPVIEQVRLSPDPLDGDVYPQMEGGGKKTRYAITKQGLMKLSATAGIMWHPVESRRIDNRSDRNYCAYRAVGGVRKADGTPIFMKAEYDLDMEVIEEETEEQYRLKAEKWDKDEENPWFRKMSAGDKRAYLQKCIKRDVLQKRKHKIKLAESGAMNRVIRALLNLKGTYTKEELQKPFVVVRIVLRPDYSDPEVRKAMIEASIKSITGIYGGGMPPIQLTEMATPTMNGEILDLGSESHGEETVPDENGVIPDENGELPLEDDAGEADPNASARADFMNCEADAQLKTLREMMKHKGYDEKKLKKPLDTFNDENRRGFFELLLGMPDQNDSPY